MCPSHTCSSYSSGAASTPTLKPLFPPFSHHFSAATATPAAYTRPTLCTRTAGPTLCGAAPCIHKTLPPKVTTARLSQVHLVDHDVPRPQRHCAHHHHGPLRVRRPAPNTPCCAHIGSRSVAASVFGLIYLAMIISTVTNLLSFTPDEQALLRAPPRPHRPLPQYDHKSLRFRQSGCRPSHPAAARRCCPPHCLLVHTPSLPSFNLPLLILICFLFPAGSAAGNTVRNCMTPSSGSKSTISRRNNSVQSWATDRRSPLHSLFRLQIAQNSPHCTPAGCNRRQFHPHADGQGAKDPRISTDFAYISSRVCMPT